MTFCHRRPDSLPWSPKPSPSHLCLLILYSTPPYGPPLRSCCFPRCNLTSEPEIYCSHYLEWSPSQTFKKMVYFYDSELSSNVTSSEDFPDSPHKKWLHSVFFISFITSRNHLLFMYVIAYCSVSLTQI